MPSSWLHLDDWLTDQIFALDKSIASGILDCVAEYNGELCLIDWKTSERVKPNLSSLYDNPLQVAAYLGEGSLSFNIHLILIHFIDHTEHSRYGIVYNGTHTPVSMCVLLK